MFLDYVSLGLIFLLMIGATAGLVVVGSPPGKIARKRNHPWAAAVNVASWIGLATAVLWPLALVWAFLPVPYPQDNPAMDGPKSKDDLSALQQRIAALESTVSHLQTKSNEANA